MTINRDQWRRIEPMIDIALELPKHARERYLERIDATEPALGPLLRQLVATHERAEAAREMETVPRLAAAPPASSDFSAGTMVGPFRLLSALGRGGMGEVWLAEQVDGRVQRQVALKLPAQIQRGPVWRERFRRERDILARLSHPHIAHLYDAGVSESEDSRGQPYLAMEVVHGTSLADHVAARKLGIAGRLLLFRQILSAVAHAHRHLVVHRDLKPANILIDADGQVKLLDFGIAKLIDDDATAGGSDAVELTRIGGRVMTLRYAAPEQVAEGAISTATDVYALGVILHELLTGQSPYAAVREQRLLTDAALLNFEPSPPSGLPFDAEAAAERGLGSAAQLARTLAGDLDAIVMKALRRNPADRYATAEAFDDDLLRYLEKRPVLARQGAWRYRAGRFAARNRWPLAVATFALVALTTGVAMVEKERRAALAEKARAEKHFDSVRKLANTFIFDVHEELTSLSGSLKAREMLVKTALEYLDKLAAETGDDPALTAELAMAYRKIGNVQGQAGAANLGANAKALANQEKARDLFVSLGDYKADDVQLQREHMMLRFTLARTYARAHDARWQEEIAETVRLADRVGSLPGAGPRDRARVAGAIAEQASLSSVLLGQSPEAEAGIEKAVRLLEALLAELPGQVGVRDNLASTYQRAANIFSGNRHTPASLERAISYRQKAHDMFTALAKEHPDDQRYPPIIAENRADFADNLSQAQRHAEARAVSREVLAQSAALVRADPANANFIEGHIKILSLAARVALRAGDPAAALPYARSALAQFGKLPTEAQAPREIRSNRADAQAVAGLALWDIAAKTAPTARRAAQTEACAFLKESVAFLDEVARDMQGAIDAAEATERRAGLARCDAALTAAKTAR